MSNEFDFGMSIIEQLYPKIKSWIWNTSEISDSNDFLIYHYTNAEGLNGIIGNQVIWATNTKFMNDPGEIIFGRETLLLRLKTIEKKAKEEEQFVKEHLVKALLKVFQYESSLSETYLFCLSRRKDLLSQWRGYTPSGGYSIGLNYQKLKVGLTTKTPTEEKQKTTHLFTNGNFLPVIYTSESTNFDDPLTSFLDQILSEITTRNKKDDVFRYRRTIVLKCYELIEYFIAYSLKSHAYEEEAEIRFFSNESQHFGLTPKFRAKNSVVVPYLELKMKQVKKRPTLLPIEEIVIGPGLDWNQARTGLTMLLKSKGYKIAQTDGAKGVKIKESSIPYRTS